MTNGKRAGSIIANSRSSQKGKRIQRESAENRQHNSIKETKPDRIGPTSMLRL